MCLSTSSMWSLKMSTAATSLAAHGVSSARETPIPQPITQNVEYLLDSVQASTMLSNSEFIIMLNQAASDREKLAKLLNISNEQMSYVTNADAGCGLMKYGSRVGAVCQPVPEGYRCTG